MRLFAIGDIHGCLKSLRLLDRELRFGAGDTMVTLGDYIDRGPDSRGVIDYLIGLATRCRLIALRGNHEVMMLAARHDLSLLFDWVSCGGDETLGSYRAVSCADIPRSHWEFLEATLPYHEAERDFFVHANARADLPLSKQPESMLYWEFLGNSHPPLPHASGRRMICGHTEQRSGVPLDFGHAVCLDTCAHGGGWLTCLETGTGDYWQASEAGELRRASLG